jgi:hypothetical protein
MMFPEIHIYNCFPTVVGEQETRIKSISTLKIGLINNVIGSDSRTLTPDEDVQSFFKDEFARTEGSKEELNWDAIHLEAFEQAKVDATLIEEVNRIPRRTRIARHVIEGQQSRAVVFSKKGENTLFVSTEPGSDAELLSTQAGLALFQAEQTEVGGDLTKDFPGLFGIAWEKLSEKHPLPEIRGRRSESLKILEALRMSLPAADVYCSDLIKVISKYDDVSEGALKDLAQVDTSNLEKCFEAIKTIVPETFIRNVLERIQRMEDEADVILLAEEFN